MENNYYGAPSTPNENFLAHYGIKGMKWGVRKAIEKGNKRALTKQYLKASKKLAKLEKRALSGSKYAKRAAKLGIAAGGMGAIAATGTKGLTAATRGVGKALGAASNAAKAIGVPGAGKLRAGSDALYRGSSAIMRWGHGNSIGKAVEKGGYKAIQNLNKSELGKNLVNRTSSALIDMNQGSLGYNLKRAGNVSNSGYARMGAALAGAGLAGAAGYNAYRAATTKRAAKKAAQFRQEMNKAFAGTQYAGGVANKPQRIQKPQKKRRR